MMDASASIVADGRLDPPPRLFDRLRQLTSYTWDESDPLFHTTNDIWNVTGTRSITDPAHSAHNPATLPGISNILAGHSPPAEPSNLSPVHAAIPLPTHNTVSSYKQVFEQPVLAQVSYHVMREERTFYIAKNIAASTDNQSDHIFKPVDSFRLPPQSGDRAAIVVSIYCHPGPNLIHQVLDLGPAFYWARKVGDSYEAYRRDDFQLASPISLPSFLDFAIGATQCLEILHHGQGIIHGEIRCDSFHFNAEASKVKLVSFGSGIRSFEHGLSSAVWSKVSRELGAKHRLLFMSPEQTGRLATEPDSRTDIYSLGVVLWSLLTQQPVFGGDSPLEIVQAVLGRRIQNASSIRLDIPNVLDLIIQKCTAKSVGDRYQSASGLRYDLVQVRDFLSNGDGDALRAWTIGQKDVSSFFVLPSTIMGREEEQAEIMRVISRVAKSHALQQKTTANLNCDGLVLMTDGTDGVDGADAPSEFASSTESFYRLNGFAARALDPRLSPSNNNSSSVISDMRVSAGNAPTASSFHPTPLDRLAKPWDRHHSMSLEARSMVESAFTNRLSMTDSSTSSLSRQLNYVKLRRRGHCEVVTIEGRTGFGRTLLLQSLLPEARKQGYCASATFDSYRKIAYGPLLRLLSSLFRQILGERNTETPFHQSLSQYVRPAWPMLHQVLELPEFLLGPADGVVPRSTSNSSNPQSQTARATSNPTRRGSSPGLPALPSYPIVITPAQRSQDYLRGGTSTKTTRLLQIYLEILRMFSIHRFICLCLDDLHAADPESLELVTHIISARLNLVLIMTYRSDEMSSETVDAIIQPADSKSESLSPRRGGPVVTRIRLPPLAERTITKYVAATLQRPEADVRPLALVVQSKTQGNPFYMKEMLSACYRKRCIWFDYKRSQWQYNLDRLHEQFRGEKDYDVLDVAFITQRLSELPAAARSILAWAALLGHSFSFALICRLIGREFRSSDESCPNSLVAPSHPTISQREAIAGMQAAIQAFVLLPSETDDTFRFANDRYVQAATALEECQVDMMHFVISQTLIKYYSNDAEFRDATASHICNCIDLVKSRITERGPFRKALYECANSAAEMGARPTAVKYYSCALELVEPDLWTVGHDETMQLHYRAAECHLFMGNHKMAKELVSIVFCNVKTAFDTASAHILEARLLSQDGNAEAALICLKNCLRGLGVELEKSPTVASCDVTFERLSVYLVTADRPSILKLGPTTADNSQASIGAVFAEAVSTAWWSDRLTYYYLTLTMMDMHLAWGAFPQSGNAFMNLAIISITRFNMVEFAVKLESFAQETHKFFRDPVSLARDHILFSKFLSHLQYPLREVASQAEVSTELSIVAGDRISTILSVGHCAQLRLLSGFNCTEVEAYCQYGCESIPNWQQDSRGGTLVIVVRQTCRALQGGTKYRVADEVLSDETHNSEAYKQWLRAMTHNGNRSLLFYESIELIPLFLYGHYDRAIQVGRRCYEEYLFLSSSRNSALILFLYGLAVGSRLLRHQDSPLTLSGEAGDQGESEMHLLRDCTAKIKQWQVLTEVNYIAWTKMLEALTAEIADEFSDALCLYEEAIDHAAEHGFLLEEAMGNYLVGRMLDRRRGRRAAKMFIREAVCLFRQLGAVGVAEWLEEENGLLLTKLTRESSHVDAGVQTEFNSKLGGAARRLSVVGEHDELDALLHEDQAVATTAARTAAFSVGVEARKDRDRDLIGAWRGSMYVHRDPDVGLPTLDMIDLHAILVSSQVISSVLRVDELLKTMCNVILQSCGALATMAAIVVRDESEMETTDWWVAVSGELEKGATAHKPGIPLAGTSLVAENVVLSCIRFRELVFVSDVVNDDRFGTVSEAWRARNSASKSAIAIPICYGEQQLLGVLYLEGESGSLTDRNVTVLQLLVNQIGISYANALAMKNIEKVSAENRSMVTMQHEALKKAREAETKATEAMMEAKRNVQLAEEAVKAKSIFLANVSHELRTPLNGVIGNSDLLRESRLEREQQDMADSIRLSADLLLTVINDILDFSKMEANKMKLFVIAFNPREMVEEVVRAVSYSNRETTSKKKVQVVQDIALPPLLIYGDPTRLHQVLGNLIGNSLKFTEVGQITIGARVETDLSESVQLTFWVEDTGIGIPPQQLARLFQPFSQADASTARKYGGSGLGLSICKSLTETMMKGKIWLQSQEGSGTKAYFTVWFDKAQPDVSAGDAQNKSVVPPLDRHSMPTTMVERSKQSSISFRDLSHISVGEISICIAEDNPINQKIAVQFVQRLGYRTPVVFENGLKAVEGLRQRAHDGQPFHIVLMDVQMPVLDGYDATRLIREDPLEAVRQVLVIAMTASAIQGDREKCLAAGMDDYLAKPVRSEVLRQKLEFYVKPTRASDPAFVGESNPDLDAGSSTEPAAAVSEQQLANGTPQPHDDTTQAVLSSSSPSPWPSDATEPPIRSSSSPTSDHGAAPDASGPESPPSHCTPRTLTERRAHSDAASTP